MKHIRLKAFPSGPNHNCQSDSVWMWSQRQLRKKGSGNCKMKPRNSCFTPPTSNLFQKKIHLQPSNLPTFQTNPAKHQENCVFLFRDIWSLGIFAKQRHWNHTSAAWAARPWRTARSPRRYRQANVKIPSAEKRRLQAVGCNGLVEGKCLVKVVKWLIDAKSFFCLKKDVSYLICP